MLKLKTKIKKNKNLLECKTTDTTFNFLFLFMLSYAMLLFLVHFRLLSTKLPCAYKAYRTFDTRKYPTTFRSSRLRKSSDLRSSIDANGGSMNTIHIHV